MTVGPWPIWAGADRLAPAAETETDTAEAATETVERGSAERLARQRAAALREQAGQRAARSVSRSVRFSRSARPGSRGQQPIATPGQPQPPGGEGLAG